MAKLAPAEVERLSRRTVTPTIETQSAFLTQEPVPEAFINWDLVHVAMSASTLETKWEMNMTKESLPLAICAFVFFTAAGRTTCAQAPPKIDPMVVPDIAVQNEDYAKARKRFHTTLIEKGPAPE